VAGSIAHEVLVSLDITGLVTCVSLTFVCLLPPPDALEEPSWLKKCRTAAAGAAAAWTEQDDDEIAQGK
jgi:hypothetical protein